MMMRRFALLPLAAACALGLALATGASAKEPAYGFGKKPVKRSGLSGKALGAHYMEGIEDYTEYWAYAFSFKSGHVLFARFLVTNLGPGDNKGAVQGHLMSPDGSITELVDGRRDSSDFMYGTGALSYSLGRHSLSGDGSSFQMKLGNWQGHTVSVNWTNVVPGYRAGKLVFGAAKQAYLDFSVMSPKATATATINVDGQSVSTEGVGYAEHWYTNYAQHDSTSAWYTLVGFAGDYTFNLTNVVTSKKHGTKRLPFLAIAKGGELVATSNRVGFSMSAMKRDAKRGYRVPNRYRITYKDKKSGDALVATLKVIKRVHRYDVVSGLSPLERFIVERITKPVQYRFTLSIKLKGKVAGSDVDVEGEGLAEVVHVN